MTLFYLLLCLLILGEARPYHHRGASNTRQRREKDCASKGGGKGKGYIRQLKGKEKSKSKSKGGSKACKDTPEPSAAPTPNQCDSYQAAFEADCPGVYTVVCAQCYFDFHGDRWPECFEFFVDDAFEFICFDSQVQCAGDCGQGLCPAQSEIEYIACLSACLDFIAPNYDTICAGEYMQWLHASSHVIGSDIFFQTDDTKRLAPPRHEH
jgi:hypothetical protein